MSNLRRIGPPTSQNVSDTEIFFTERMSLVPSDIPMLNRECISSHANMLLILDNKLGASAHGYSDPIANRSPHDPLTASAGLVPLPAPRGLALHAMSHDARRSGPPAARAPLPLRFFATVSHVLCVHQQARDGEADT